MFMKLLYMIMLALWTTMKIYDMLWVMNYDKYFCHDAWHLVKQVKDNSIICVISHPPKWGFHDGVI